MIGFITDEDPTAITTTIAVDITKLTLRTMVNATQALTRAVTVQAMIGFTTILIMVFTAGDMMEPMMEVIMIDIVDITLELIAIEMGPITITTRT